MKKLIIACSATLMLISCSSSKHLNVIVYNQADFDRNKEIIEINKSSVVNKLGLKTNERFILLDHDSNQVDFQIASNSNQSTDSLLIFPVSVKANSKASYTIKKGIPAPFQSKAYGRFVPERKDDYCWENDRIAFRVYGPTLQATGEISSGIDVWTKRTDKLIINKWYADDLTGKQSYHTDHGEGLDMYKVGPTLGAGATTPFVNQKLWFSKNFVSYEILDNGPMRTTVKLNYASFPADKTEISETRIITLDANSQLNKITLIYNFKGNTLPVATGIVTRNSKEEKKLISTGKNYFLHAEPTDSINGELYEAVIGEKSFTNILEKDNHILGIQQVNPNEKYTYYQGAGWNKWGFETFDAWGEYVKQFSKKLENPLKITIK